MNQEQVGILYSFGQSPSTRVVIQLLGNTKLQKEENRPKPFLGN